VERGDVGEARAVQPAKMAIEKARSRFFVALLLRMTNLS